MSPLVASALYDELAAIGAAAADGESFDATAIDAIAEAGLLHVSVPKEVGGAELPVLDAIDVWSEIARADASIGWVAFAMDTALAYFGAYLPEEGIADLFADGPPRMAGQFAPNGTAVAEGDDWIVDGAYQFGSGITIAQVAGCGFLATPPGGGDPAYLFGCLPVEEVDLRGNWHVLGLRATQSVDYRITGARVPAHRTFDFFAPTVHRGGALARFGVLPLTAVGHAAWALGATRRVLDELLVAAGRTRMGAASSIGTSDHGLITIARLESRYRAGRAWVREVCEQAEAEVEATGELLSAATGDLVRQACVHVNQDGAAIARDAYLLAGTSALRDGALQRGFRDLHAGAQHFFASDAASLDWARGLLAREG
ncbi:MAG: acyl-CoA dehydrogenase family protein [Acidimicrobiales bacterium]